VSARSFLDTTIVLVASDASRSEHKGSVACIADNAPAEAPQYALRELLAGDLQNLCDLHNRLKSADNIGEALAGLASLPPFVGRKKSSGIEEFARQLEERFSTAPETPLVNVKDEMAQSLALKIVRIWVAACESSNWTLVQPLSCFRGGEFDYGAEGDLRAPSDTFNCDKSSRCSAAGYMYDRVGSVSKLSDVLHPDKLPEKLQGKAEVASRRKALKDLRNSGPKSFNKRGCRALGDAYFVVMCPPGASVISTNSIDFDLMCEAVGGKLIVP